MPDPSAVASRVLRRRVVWLDAATAVSRGVLGDPDGDLRRLATAQGLAAAQADTASLILPTAQATELTNVVSVGLGADVYEDATFLARDSALGRAIVAGQPLVIGQILPWATDHDDPPNPLALGPAMSLPLHDPLGRNAALLFSRTSDRAPFDADEHEYAAPFAALVSLALRHADERAAAVTSQARAARERATQALHDDVIQRLFAVGVGLQSVIDLGAGPEATDRLNGYLADLDEMINVLRRDGTDDGTDQAPTATGPTGPHG